MTNNTDHTPPFDPLDMNNYHIEKLPKVQKTGVERFLQRIGGPLAILAFVLIYWVANISFINRIDTNEKTTPLTESAMARYAQIEKAKTKQLTCLLYTSPSPRDA